MYEYTVQRINVRTQHSRT